MAWIESHQSLGGHLKLRRLARILRIHRAQAIGHLHLLWWWALDGAPTGDLSGLTSEEIAELAEWPGDANAFVSALKACGWIDPDGRLHDWADYAGRLIDERRQARERMRRHRERLKTEAEAQEKQTGPIPVCSPNVRRTQCARLWLPNPTEQYPRDIVDRENKAEAVLDVGSVQAPAGFPRTEAEVEEGAALKGVEPEFALKIWHLASSRGWRDSRGVLLRNWSSYLAASVAFAREESAQGIRRDRGVRTSPRSRENDQNQEIIQAPFL